MEKKKGLYLPCKVKRDIMSITQKKVIIPTRRRVKDLKLLTVKRELCSSCNLRRQYITLRKAITHTLKKEKDMDSMLFMEEKKEQSSLCIQKRLTVSTTLKRDINTQKKDTVLKLFTEEKKELY